MEEIRVYLLSLGCAKNLVDSEVMCGALKKRNFILTDDPSLADVIIINTCGFIEAAKKESIEAILNLAQYKDQGACRALIAVGCMTEKYADEMCEAIPELDAVAGSRDYELIADLVNKTIGLDQAEQTVPPSNCFLLRDLDFSSASAYLKIAEGCDNCCSYCLIPQLRGPLRSRPMADILEEAQFLYDKGIRELNVIAQDTTAYGCDTHGKSLLAELMEQLAQIPFVMIRLLYVYPDSVNDELLQVMATHDNICHYLDIPVQHGCDKILAAMNRHSSRQGILDSLARIRKWLPDVVLRSTVMVGFPGETEQDFEELLDFLQQAQFDWLGVFPYYQEEDTPAAVFEDQLDSDIKQERVDRVMQLSAVVTQGRLEKYIDKKMPVLAETPAFEFGENWHQGRCQYQAPEVDGVVYFYSEQKEINYGSVYQVQINKSDIYDLMGVII